MTPDQFLAKHIGDTTGHPVDSVIASTNEASMDKGVLLDADVPVKDWAGMAVSTGEQMIVETVKRTDAERKSREDTSRLMMAVREAMKPDTVVGKIAPEGPLAEPQPLAAPMSEQEVAEAQMMEKSLQEAPHEPTEEEELFAASLDEAPHVPVSKQERVVPEEAEEVKAPAVSAETFRAFATVEGNRSKAYKDSQGLTTVGVGFNMEQKGAEKIWEQAGVNQSFDDVKAGVTDLSQENVQRLLGVTIKSSERKAEARAEKLGLDWDTMPQWHKDIVTDIAFNTGSVSGWTKVFTNTNPLAVLREARRREGGKNTMGMDNRVARIGISLGIIKSVAQARQLGLKLTKLSENEVAKLRGGYEQLAKN